MALFTLSGVTGGAAVLLGDIRTGDIPLSTGPLLVPALLLGDLRQTVYVLRGSIDIESLLAGALNPSIPPLVQGVAQLDAAWAVRWSSHTPVLGVSDLEGDGSFVRLGDANAEGVPSSIYGRVVGAAVLEGSFPLNAVLSGQVTVAPLLVQSFNFQDVGDSPVVIGTGVLLGSFNLQGARRSPPFALFDGTNFLQRVSSDAVLHPAGAFTISVTFDPELIEPGQDCVVVAKNNQTDTQAGWKVTYAVATGLVTFTAYGAADGSISVARPTSTAVRVRSRFTAIVDGTGAITLYVDGSANQGVQSTVGLWSGMNATTEPFSIACDEPSNGGTNRMKGAVYDFALWSTDLSGGEAALLLPDGFLPDGVNVVDLEVYWAAEDITAATSNGTFLVWTDRIAGLALSAGNPSAYRPIYCLVSEAGVTPSRPPLLFTHVWNSLLADSAVARPDQTLTTTHRLSLDTRWRLWSPGSVTPQIPGLFRQYRGDLTLTVMFSRVSGANTIVIAKLYGLRIEWQSTNSFFVISGDDNVGSTNERYDFNVALTNGRVEPTENVVPNASTVLVTLRYNAFSRDLDIFFNGVRSTLGARLTGQSAFERSTGLLFAEFGDWRLASVIPACLTDAQVVQMLSSFQPVSFANPWRPGMNPYHGELYSVWDRPIRPFHDNQLDEPTPVASSPTTVSGILSYATEGGVQPGSVTISMPRLSSGSMAYTDNGSGAFVPSLGAQPIATSSISYVGAQASGSVTLTGQPADGDTVTLVRADGLWSVTFEFDTGSAVVGGNFRVVVGVDATTTATNLRAAIQQNPLLDLTVGGSGLVIVLVHNARRVPVTSIIAVVGVNLTKADFTGGIWPGTWSIQITSGGDEFHPVSPGVASYFWLSRGSNPVPALIPFDWIEMLLTQVYVNATQPGDHLYADAPYIVKDGFDEDDDGSASTSFIDPDPVIVNVTVNAAHVVTAVVNAGPTDAGPVISWWEIELVSGSTEVMVMVDRFQPNQFSVNRNHTDIFAIPPGQDWNEKRIRFVIQSVRDGTQIWRSLFFRMLGEDYDNAPPDVIVVPGTPTTPELGVGDLLTTEERERLVIARRALRPVQITPQASNSRYKLTKVYEGDRGRELGLLESLPDLIGVGANYRTYAVRSPDVGFLDKIAVQFYGAGFEWAWWVIAYANNMVDPDQEMFVGQRLVIPPREALLRFVARAPVTTLST